PPPPPPPAAIEWRLSVRTGPDTGRVEKLADGDQVLIGRAPEARLLLQDPRVSSRHALVRREGDRVTVQDLGSANGTLINGDALEGAEPRTLKAGDEIQVGETVVVA